MNTNLLQLLLGTMTSQSSVNSISEKTGLSGKQVQKLILLALPLLIKYMTGNASSGSGALSLLGALSQHTSKKGMDRQLADADEKDGSKIIDHILGKNEAKVTQDLCAQTGLNASQIHQVLSIIAPALMSGVSAAASASKPVSGNSAGKGASGAETSLLSELSGQGIFGSLLSLGKDAKEDQNPDSMGASSNGTALLQALLKAAAKKS